MKYRLFMAIALMTGAIGCSVDVLEVDQEESLKIVFEASPFVDGDSDADTRTSVVPNETYSNYEFIWSAKDTVGIYPDAGSQIFFTMENGAGASSATFDGGAWTCKEGHTFRSYYPFIGNIYLDATKIPVSFTGQKQVGNDNSDHFQKYDYMYTAATTKDNGFLNFSYSHLITAVLPWVELPAGHYTGLTLSLEEALFVTEGEYDLTAASPAIVGKKYSDSMSIELDVTFTSPDILKVYVPLAPMDMSGKTLTITITNENGREFQYTYKPSKPYAASKIYRLKSATSFVQAMPEAVDLGLPSGLKWASFNLGASAPEEYGDYYAWGETEPYYSSQDPLIWRDGKTGYDWSSYKWCMGSNNTMTKYCSNSSYGYNGFTDTKILLDSEDDAASVKLGGKWRMPTDAEFFELRTECFWEWTSMNGINGQKVTGPNGNSIFLPAAGYYDGSDFGFAGTAGYYWSSSLSPDAYGDGPDTAWLVDFWPGDVYFHCYSRYRGQSIRPVYGEFISVESVSLNKTSLEVEIGRSRTLFFTVLPENAADKSVTWSSSNESIATVSSVGVVTGVAVGSAVITVTTNDGGKTATCSVTVSEATVPVLEAVDLGLPSGLKWASFNLGASAPEEYGDYFAWGETEPYYSSQDPLIWRDGKTGYDWSSYKWCMGSNNTMTKYCSNSSYGYNGFTDTKILLDSEDDAASVKLGGKWRMPTDAEFFELRTECFWRWISMKGINGQEVTGPNGNSIFLPAAGYYDGSDFGFAGTAGYYWSSSLSPDAYGDGPDTAWLVDFWPGDVYFHCYSRYRGQSIRPVSD